MKKFVYAASMLLTSLTCFGQESDEYVHRYVGIGIRASIFQLSELNQSNFPANRIIVNVDPIKYARAEFHFGRYSSDYDLVMSTTTLKPQEASTIIGFGVFGVYPVEKVKFIAGFRYSINNYAFDDVEFDQNSNPYLVEETGKITIASPVLGGEYFFAKWFSLGAEFSYLMAKDVFNPSGSSPDQKSSYNVTESCLIFRFYPR